MTPKEYVNSLNLDYKAEFIPQSKSRNAGDKSPSLNWRVTVGPVTCDYMQGIAHLPGYDKLPGLKTSIYNDERVQAAVEQGRKIRVSGIHARLAEKLDAPDLTDVFWSLVMDADAVEYGSFEEWAETFGYDTDSREAEKIYRQCLEIGLKLRQVINLDEAREVFQDY